MRIRCGADIKELELEEYLVGVVLSAMPASFELEALKAQAVAARTFALSSNKHDDYDLCSDSACCQAWSSREALENKLGVGADAYWNKVKQAVTETAGQVLTYNGSLIDAVYFSCAGGATEDAVAVWGSNVPYLQSVSSDGEDAAPRYESKVTVDVAKFQTTLQAEFPDMALKGAPSTWLGEVLYTRGGGVDSMEIGHVFVSGTRLRTLFGLNSTALTVSVNENCVVFDVKGFGHRVGLSQYGANAMAMEGKSYQQILRHYYSGVSIEEKTP
jgi:stage II sporulation protein D